MSQTLYVVMGSTGEYSDRSEWPVRAFVDETAAQAFVTNATQWLRERRVLDPYYDEQRDTPPKAGYSNDVAGYEERNAIGDTPPDFDPGLTRIDYSGAHYYVMNVPLDDDVRQAVAASVESDVEAGKLPRRAIALRGIS